MQITFKIRGFLVNVSSHGYFIIFARNLPAIKFSRSIPCQLYSGSVSELDPEIKYLPDVDDLNIDLTDPKLKEACERFVEEHLEELEKLDREATEKWERMVKNKPPLIGYGDTIKIGDYIDSEGEVSQIVWYSEETNEVVGKMMTGPFKGACWEGALKFADGKRKFKKLSKEEAMLKVLEG